VAVYVIWSSQVGGKERSVGKAAEMVSDRRARHYWDGDQLVGKAFQPLLRTPGPAWDVWMLFDKGVRWEGASPPRPASSGVTAPRTPAQQQPSADLRARAWGYIANARRPGEARPTRKPAFLRQAPRWPSAADLAAAGPHSVFKEDGGAPWHTPSGETSRYRAGVSGAGASGPTGGVADFRVRPRNGCMWNSVSFSLRLP
jgi:hypothetical protein